MVPVRAGDLTLHRDGRTAGVGQDAGAEPGELSRIYLPRLQRILQVLDVELQALEKQISQLQAQLQECFPTGKIQWKYVRCGKRCHCQAGRGHGPYAYVQYRINGQVRTQYLGKDPKLPEGAVNRETYRALQRELSLFRRRREELWERCERAYAALAYGGR